MALPEKRVRRFLNERIKFHRDGFYDGQLLRKEAEEKRRMEILSLDEARRRAFPGKLDPAEEQARLERIAVLRKSAITHGELVGWHNKRARRLRRKIKRISSGKESP